MPRRCPQPETRTPADSHGTSSSQLPGRADRAAGVSPSEDCRSPAPADDATGQSRPGRCVPRRRFALIDPSESPITSQNPILKATVTASIRHLTLRRAREGWCRLRPCCPLRCSDRSVGRERVTMDRSSSRIRAAHRLYGIRSPWMHPQNRRVLQLSRCRMVTVPPPARKVDEVECSAPTVGQRLCLLDNLWVRIVVPLLQQFNRLCLVGGAATVSISRRCQSLRMLRPCSMSNPLWAGTS